MLEHYHRIQLKPKATDELKVALQTTWKCCHNILTKRWQTSQRALVPTWLWLPMVVTLG